jgi:hypothetical protein
MFKHSEVVVNVWYIIQAWITIAILLALAVVAMIVYEINTGETNAPK